MFHPLLAPPLRAGGRDSSDRCGDCGSQPSPPVIYSGPVYTPGYHVSPGVYVYPQVRTTPTYVYPSHYHAVYPYSGVYPYSTTYPYSITPYGSYYNSWITPSLYPTVPYSGSYYGYSYYYRW